MAEEIPRFIFRPNQEEYVFLKSSDIEKNWTEQCHQWIAIDRAESINKDIAERKQERINVIESVRNGLLIIGLGLLILLMSQGSIIMTPEIILVIDISAIALVLVGFISIFYRSKKNGRATTRY